MIPGQRSLNNVLQSIAFSNPGLAERLQPDFAEVAIYALGMDKTGGKDAADRLRRAAFDLPVIQARVLETALEDLGY